MRLSPLSPVQQRVLGCLIEKRWTTPDQYPLSLNALRLACNQSTNRDPVTSYDEPTVRDAAQRLSKYGLARLASGHTTRAIKYRHLAEESLSLDRPQLAVLGVLLLRGAQTPGELKARSERLAPVPTLADVERILDELGRRGYAERLERRPGQKEERYVQLLGGGADGAAPSEPAAGAQPAGAPAAESAPRAPDLAAALEPGPDPAPAPDLAAALEPGTALVPGGDSAPDADKLEARVAALEADVADLRAQLADLLG
ncbi:MAG: YceH family protein [Solirubrobacterales bacterium]|nr:YceH family protein [Solirubrobacterales bacterium]